MKITFHRFNMSDVEDVDIYVAEPIYQWQQTEQGRWVMEHAHSLTYNTQVDSMNWGYDVVIRGEINDPKRITEYFLRWTRQERSW
jgi:hypothetical protein